MSSMDFSIDFHNTSSKKSSGPDSDSDDHSVAQSSPPKRNREADKSLVVRPTEEENEYRSQRFPRDDYSAVKKSLVCTVCGCKLAVQAGETINAHIYLQVPVCKKCKTYYGSGDFSVDEDGTDKFCRWCGNGGILFCCSTCTCVFCQKCVKQNLGRDAARKIDKEDSWDCFICDIKPLWKLRAACWGAQKEVEFLDRKKKMKVNETLLELSEKKHRPQPRRKLARRKSASSTDSDDEATKRKAGKESSGTDSSTKLRSTSKPRVRKLFSQKDAALSFDSETDVRSRRARRATKKLPETQTDCVELLSSDSDFVSEPKHKTDKNKKAALPPKKGEVLRNGIEGKGKDKQKPPLEKTKLQKTKRKTGDSSSGDDSDGSKEGDKLTRTKRADGSSTSPSSDSDTRKSPKKSSKPVSKKSSTSDDSDDESKPAKGKGNKKPAFFESQAKEFNIGIRKKKEKYESTEASDDEDERNSFDQVVASKSFDRKNASSPVTDSNSDDKKPRKSRKRFSKSVPRKADSSDESDEELEVTKRGKGKDQQKPPFVDKTKRQKTKRKTGDSSSGDDSDASKEGDKLTKSKPVDGRCTSPSSDSDTRKSTKKSSKPVSKKADSSGESDEELEVTKKGKEKDKKKKESSSTKRNTTKNEVHGRPRRTSRAADVPEKKSDSEVSFDSRTTLRRPGRTVTSRGNGSKTLDGKVSITRASRHSRRSSCDVPDSASKEPAKKRSASAEESFGTNRTRSVSSEKTVKECDDRKRDSTTSESSEDSDMPSTVDETLSSTFLQSMHEHCIRSRELGENLCKVSTTIDSKVNSASNLNSTSDIVKVYKRLKRMSKCVHRNMISLESAFKGRYKSWKQTARKTKGKGKASISEPTKASESHVRGDMSQFLEELQLWQDGDITYDESVKKKTNPKRSQKSVSEREKTSDLSSDNESNKREQETNTHVDAVFDALTEETCKSPLDAASLDVKKGGSLASASTQPYDYEKQMQAMPAVEDDLQPSKTDEENSRDMFSDVEQPLNQPSPETEKTNGKRKPSKKSGSKLSAETVDESDDSPLKPAEDERVQSSDDEDFPEVSQKTDDANGPSGSPAANVGDDKKSSGSENEVVTPRKPGPKSRTTAASTGSKSKKKGNVSVGDSPPENGESTEKKRPVRKCGPKSKTRLLFENSKEEETKSKEDLAAEVFSSGEPEPVSSLRSTDELSPDKAKALLLASSSEDETRDESDAKMETPSKKTNRKSEEKISSSSKGEKRSSGRDARAKRRSASPDASDKSTNKNNRRKTKSKRSSSDASDGSIDKDDRRKSKSKRSSSTRKTKRTIEDCEKRLDITSQPKWIRRLLRSFHDDKLVQIPIVEVHRVRKKELLEYGIDKLPKNKKKAQEHGSDSDDESLSIARLINLKTPKRKRSKHGSSSGSGSADDRKSSAKKPSKKKAKKAKADEEEEELAKVLSGSDDGVEDAVAEEIPDQPLNEQELHDMNNRQLKERLLATSSDDDDNNDLKPEDTPKKKTPKKDKKDSAEEADESSTKKKKSKKKSKEDDDSDGKKGSGSDDSDIIPSKKNRRHKLLEQNLSMSDSSEEEAKFKAKEAKLKKGNDSAESSKNSDSDDDAMRKTKRTTRKSPRGSKIKSDDSDSDVQTVSSASTNSDDDFVVSKKKRKAKSTDSDSSGTKKKKKVKRRRIKTPKGDSSDSDIEEVDTQNSTPGKGRKNIRKMMTEESVGEQTKRAAREESERKKRIEEKQALYNKLYGTDGGVKDKNVVTEKLVLDFDPETKEELVKVHDSIVRKLKPHQVKGVQFMWNVCYESVKQLEKNKGAGCILAHCMGLGKSFQVVALVHTLLVNPLTRVKTVLVVCPLSTVLNWVNEFRIWLKDTKDEEEVDVFELSRYKKPIERMHKLQEWKRNGGVMVMNYDLYRTLSLNKTKKLKQSVKDSWHKSLVDPGPDLVVCDEGHLLKNEDTALSKAMRKVKTLRRIVLTGTPLQNNLVEYHCMVNFVRPNLLGTRKEFLNRFVNPITNGQYEDSTAHDVKIMKRRAHVLHKMLDGIVQRYDYAELMPFLPEKQEYVISVRLSEPQTKIYQHFLDNLSGLTLLKAGAKNSKLLSDWHVFQRINTHPKVLLYHDETNVDKNDENETDSEGSLKDFIDDDDDDTTPESASSSGSGSDKKVAKPPPPRRRLRGNAEPEEPEPPPPVEHHRGEEWWREYCTDDVINGINSSGKLAILFSLLRECEIIGDKVLVFSQSLFSLKLIEDFLVRIDRETRRLQKEAKDKGAEPEPDPQLGGHTGTWVKGYDYFRLDGSISAENRNTDCKRFNNKSDHRARLYLISTRAGGLGINLVAANRVIVFDASWNPSHDVQSIFRVFRFGQQKPCFIYRFLAYSTIEERVYERQVTKLSLSCRVVDEQQIDRHYTNKDIMAMYTFDHEHKTDRPTPILPKDRLLAELLKEHGQWIETYHEHDSLLENKAEEELNEEERKAAWEEYEFEKRPQISNEQYSFMLKNNVEALRTLLRAQNPDADEAAIEAHLVKVRVQVEAAEAHQAFLQKQRMMIFQQQQQQMSFNNMQRPNPYHQYATQASTSGGNYQVNMNAALNAAYQSAQPFRYPMANPVQYQQGHQLMKQLQQPARKLVPYRSIAPSAVQGAVENPRITVRNFADMQQKKPQQGSVLPKVNFPGAQLTAVTNPAGSFKYPKVDSAATGTGGKPPQQPPPSGAPMSPINLD